MTSRLALNLNSLDERLQCSVILHAEGVAYLSRDSYFRGDRPTYLVVLDLFGREGHGIAPALIMNSLGTDKDIIYPKANICFFPVQAGDVFFNSHSFVNKCEAIYHRGKFILGNEDRFKEYGITILGDDKQ